VTQSLILGIDPGLKNTGWGVITSFKNKESYLSHGVIKTSSKDSLGKRLFSIYSEMVKLTEEFKPSFISVEKIFSNINPESTLKLGKARGIIFLVAAMYKIKITEYSPNSVKKNLIGYGHANKFQIIEMIKRLYPEVGQIEDNAADALAVAICHSMQTQSKIQPL
tara:strand:- start:970 stop:1464 length:495 start_codon:yes stop_codon:yes gene_type:complete